MGKGDKKSRRGKIHIGSHGVRRPRKLNVNIPVAVAPKPVDIPAKEVKVKKSPKTVEPVEPVAEKAVEAAVEVKKPVRKTTKKAKEEPAAE